MKGIIKRIMSKIPTHILIAMGFGFIIIQASYSFFIFLSISLHYIFPNIITINLESNSIVAHSATVLSGIMIILGIWSIAEIIDRM